MDPKTCVRFGVSSFLKSQVMVILTMIFFFKNTSI